MKKLILMALTLVVVNSQAQLLKKIKEKAQDVIEPKKTNTTTGSGTDDNSSGSKSGGAKNRENWTPGPNDQKIFSLEPGETFLYDETRVITKAGKLSYAFVVQNRQYKYFLIEDGQRTGPFDEAPVSKLAGMRSEKTESTENDEDQIKIGGNDRDPVATQYSKTINNKLFIVFNGKNFGPYDYVAKMVVSPDQKKFWAAVTIGGMNEMMAKMGMGNLFIVNEAGIKQQSGTANVMPARLLISREFGAAALTVLDNVKQTVITVSSTGKSQEGTMMEALGSNELQMMVGEKGDILSIPSQSPRQLLVNGEETAMFSVPVKSIHRLFIMPDYKKSVYYQAGKIYRGDGSEEDLSGIVFPKFVTINGERMIYYYKLLQNESSAKDVYLCKKTL